MEHSNTIVAKAQGAKATTTATKYYWVNHYNVRTNELTDSMPFDTKEDAIKHAEDFVETFNKSVIAFNETNKGKRFLPTPLEKIGENKWMGGNTLTCVAEYGDMMLHLKVLWEMEGIATAVNELGIGDDEEFNTTPSRSLVGVMYFVHELDIRGNKTVRERDDIVRDICHRYYTDADTKATFDRRADLLKKAKTTCDVAMAIFAD